MARDGFTVVLGARRGPVDLQSFQRPPAWPPLILVIYIHRHLRRKPLRLVHADSQRDLHWVINSCCPLPCGPLVTGVNFKGLAELEGVDVRDGCIRAVGMWSPAINYLLYHTNHHKVNSCFTSAREQCIGTASDWRDTGLSLHLPEGFLWAFFLFETGG